MANVILREIHKKFDQTEVLKNVDISVGDGEFVVLVGPSGCGKSTLLRMIAGLDDATAGDVIIDGEVINHKAPYERDIAMVFQSYALYPHMNVAKNMSFALEMAKVSKGEIDRRVKEAAGLLGLGSLLHRKPSQLSGGQRQRVAMGRAIVRHPKVFLFDEPLSNLDAKLRVSMRSEIKLLHKRLNSTIIYVTHDQIEAMTMADRIVVMDAGRVSQIGAPLELYDHPANMFVASFIGSPAINFIDATLRHKGAHSVAVLSDNTEWLIPRRVGTDGQSVVCGVRPEGLYKANPGDAGAIKLDVMQVEPTGAETHVIMNFGGHSVTGVFRERIALRPGESIVLVPDLAKLSVFDKATGLAL
jgi:multiple sugar transport system ATP-binding protein